MSASENLPIPLLPMSNDGRKSDEIDAAIVFGFLNTVSDMEALTEWVLINAAEA